MIKVESGRMVPLAEPFPNLAPGLPGESGFQDEESNTAAWVSQCIETSGLSLDPGLDFESLFGSLASGNFPVNADLMDVDSSGQSKIESTTLSDAVESPAQPVTPISVPASPASSDSSYHQSTNPVPRHKRPSHKRAELKRRDKIKNRLDDLKAEVPSIADKGKMSESAILIKAAEYAKRLKGDCERFTTEAANLRQEIESLSTKIHTFQEHLPAAGLKPEGSEEQALSLDQLCDSYVVRRTKESWKFYLFSFFMKPLFKSYKEETTPSNLNTFMSSVVNWTRDSLGLSALRPQSLEIMREICKETDIMSHPETLPQQALASVGKTASSAQPAMEASRPTAHPVPVQPPVSASFAAPTSLSRPSAVSRRESSTSRRSAQTSRPVRDRSPKVRTVSPRNLLPAAPRPVPSGSALSASPPKHFTPVKPKQVPSHQPLASLSPTLARNIAPKPSQQSVAGISVGPTPTNIFTMVTRPAATQQSAAGFSVGPAPTNIFTMATRPAASQQSVAGISVGPAPANIFTMATRPAANQQSVAGISVSPAPTNIFTMATRPAATQQTVGATDSCHVDDITQLAASVGETSIRHGRPTATIAPNMFMGAGSLDTQVAQFTIGGIAGTNFHIYDFDITDIPLPELPDSVLPSPQPCFTTASPFAGLTTIEAFPHCLGSSAPIVAQSTSSVLTLCHSTAAVQSTTATTATSGAGTIANPSTSSGWS
ncbi:uncharacterized protein [Littorina saxatilis]|uniref:BHLH domain-containing protein n=1 Tax=Littorina saxatilis TaxID=31220 RepID=A0AAN9BL46_9CAEN